MDSSTYRHLFGPIVKSCIIPHHNFPCHNLLSLDTLLNVSRDIKSDVLNNSAEFLGCFPCYQPFPYAIQKNSVLFCGSGVTDHATELVIKKIHWEKKLKNLRVSNIDLAIMHIKSLRQKKVVKLSSSLKKYIQHFQNDPEPKFSGNYNWLYTSGCLSYDEDNCDGAILISADFCDKKSRINILKLNNKLDEVQFRSFTELKTSSPVLQITSKSQRENLMIGVRQKNYLSLFNSSKASSLSHPIRLWRKKVVGSKLLTSFDIKENCEEVIVADSNHDVHVFQVEKKTKVYGCSGSKIAANCNRDSWSQVAFGEHGIYWAFRNCFAILDLRDLYSGTKLEFLPSAVTNDCEDICSFVKSPSDSNNIYLGTTHNILQVDLRNGKTVQRWTHLMKNPPQFMTCMKDKENSEILVLQSHNVDEFLGIVNEYTTDGDSDYFVSKSLPRLLKNIKESLKLTHFHGVGLNPFVVKKIEFAVTGMQFLKNSQGDIILFTTNSGGDIFLNKIKKTSESSLTDKDEQEIVNTMKQYESHCEKLHFGNTVKRNLDVIDMSRLLENLKDSEVKAQKRKTSEVYWKYHEMYAPESLKFYKDFLAQKILSVWGFASDESESEFEAMSVDDKVREWMNKC